MENEIKLLLSSNELRDEIVDEGLKYVQKFRDEVIVQEINNVYRNLLED